MTVSIDSMAAVDPAAELGERVAIGPFCRVGPEVVLEDDVELVSHVVVGGRCRIGAGTRVFPFASLGLAPQDRKYRGEPSELVIGRSNVIREHVTMHTGTAGGRMVTQVGDDNLFMVGVHVAHDCIVGNGVTLANQVALGGHVTIGNRVIIGGLSAVHQFTRIGDHAYVGAMTIVRQDVIPWGIAVGEFSQLCGLNLIGMQRFGLSRRDIHGLRAVYRALFEGDGRLAERLERAEDSFGCLPAARQILDFMRGESRRRILQPRRHGCP